MYCARYHGRIPANGNDGPGPQPSQSHTPYRVVSLSQRFSKDIIYPTVRGPRNPHGGGGGSAGGSQFGGGGRSPTILSPNSSANPTPTSLTAAVGGSRPIFPSSTSFSESHNGGGGPHYASAGGSGGAVGVSSFVISEPHHHTGGGGTAAGGGGGGGRRVSISGAHTPPTLIYASNQAHLNQAPGLDVTPYYSFVASRKKILFDIALSDLLEALRGIAPPELRKKIVSLQQLTAGNLFSSQLTAEGAQRTRIGKQHDSGVATRALLTGQLRPSSGGAVEGSGAARSASPGLLGASCNESASSKLMMVGGGGSGRSPSGCALSATAEAHHLNMMTQSCMLDPASLAALRGETGGVGGAVGGGGGISGTSSGVLSSCVGPEGGEMSGKLLALVGEKFNKLIRKVQQRETSHRGSVHHDEANDFVKLMLEVEERHRISLHFEEQRCYVQLAGVETSEHLSTYRLERLHAQSRNLGAVETALRPKREALRAETNTHLEILSEESDSYSGVLGRQCDKLVANAFILVSARVEKEHRLQLEERRLARHSVFASEL